MGRIGRVSVSLFKRFVCLTISTFVALGNLASAESQKNAPRLPMKEKSENSLRYVWLNKKVHESRLLHDMENLSGPKVIHSDCSVTGIAQIELTHDRSIDGSASLRFQTSLRDDELMGSCGGKLWGQSSFSHFSNLSRSPHSPCVSRQPVVQVSF